MLNKRVFFKAAVIITLATLLSKVLGLVRQQYSIYLFADDIWEFDSFVAAFRIPNALRELLAEGALSAAFIPIFSSILVKAGKKEAFVFANRVLTIALILTSAVVVLGMISSGFFMHYYHNNPDVPESTALATSLFNTMMFYLPFISLSALMMGMLNSMDRFTIPALGPFFSNVIFLSILAVFSYSLGIHTLAYATIAGGFLYFIIQVPSLYKEGFRFRFSLDFKDPYIKELFTLFVPFALAMGIPKLNNILSNIFSDEIMGANTALSQGFFIVQLPLSIFVAGISMVSLPNMSKMFEKKDFVGLKNLILMAVRMVLFFTLPSVVGLMLLDFEVVRFIYRDLLAIFSGASQGKINDGIITNISIAQYYFAPGIIAMGLSIIVIRAFQSMKDMKTMIFTAITTVIFHLSLMTVLLKYMDWSFNGIALSISVSSFFNLFLLVMILLKKLGGFQLRETLISIAKMIGGIVVMALVILYLKPIVYSLHIAAIEHIDNIIGTIVLITLGFLSYTGTLFILKETEFRAVVNRLLSKFLPK